MAADIEFSLIGLDSVLKNLDYVSDVVAGKKARAALRKAANVVADKAREGAEKLDDTGTGRKIADNIAVRWNGRRFKRDAEFAFRIGVLKGAVLAKTKNPDTSSGAPTPHWRLLEFGTKVSPAKPFLRPALANNISLVTDTFVTELDKALQSAIKRGKTL
jgi:HK97 gp10 family phage protein